MQPNDGLFRVSCSACVAGELQQVVPGFVVFSPQVPTQQKAWHGGKGADGSAQGQAAMLDFSSISCRKKELCQFEG